MSRVRQTTTTAEQRLARLERAAKAVGLSPVRDKRSVEVEHADRLLRFTCSGRTTMKVLSFVPEEGDGNYELDAFSIIGDASCEGVIIRLSQVEPA